jgi:ABC-type glutathione transport system ATPase component
VADRIVVMNQGAIEQVGDALQVYRDPSSLFVADFVGRINVLGATAIDTGRLRIGTHEFHCAHSFAQGRSLRVYLRPEDVLARPIPAGDPNVFEAQIEKIEFMGPYCLVRVGSAALAEPQAHRVPVAQLPGRSAARGRQPLCRCAWCRSACASSSKAKPVSAVLKSIVPVRQQVHWSERIAHVALTGVALALLAFLAAPLTTILQQSLQDTQGRFAGLANFIAYAKTPALLESCGTACGCRRWSP